MEEYKNIRISDFTYDLPDSRIAKYPLNERDQSKLLVWKKGEISETVFEKGAAFIPEHSMLFFNNTRVIHARMFFKKETGAKIEIFCLEPVFPADYQISFQQENEVVWKCMVGNSKKWKNGILKQELEIEGKTILLSAEKIKSEGNSFHILFRWNKAVTFAKIIEHAGTLPIPPYLNRETEDSDEESYQTVYAKIDGSVAAPTAGLHFTESYLRQLTEKNILTREITLHVGAGTFQPVKSDTIHGHEMHHEMVLVSKKIIEELIGNSGPVIAVGTTSVRSLESLYWIGIQIENQSFNPENPEIKQWEPYNTGVQTSSKKSLQNILHWLNEKNLDSIRFSTQIIILPGYDFKIIDGMFTNFHQPQSTLLLLIGAFLGSGWKEVYDYALKNDFRFLSYGDSNLYLK